MRTAKEVLEGVRMYGRSIYEFLLPDQVEFIEKAIEEHRKEYAMDCLKKAADNAKVEQHGAVGGYIQKVNKESITDESNLI